MWLGGILIGLRPLGEAVEGHSPPGASPPERLAGQVNVRAGDENQLILLQCKLLQVIYNNIFAYGGLFR